MLALFPLWRASARRVNSLASRLPGTTRLRFALHGAQREQRPSQRIGEVRSRARRLELPAGRGHHQRPGGGREQGRRKGLQTEAEILAAWCNPKGRVIWFGKIRNIESGFALSAPADTAEDAAGPPAAKALRLSRVALGPYSGTSLMGLQTLARWLDHRSAPVLSAKISV